MSFDNIHKSWGVSIRTSIGKVIYSATLVIFSLLTLKVHIILMPVWMIHFLNLLICILDSHILVDCFTSIFIFLLHCEKLRALKPSCDKNVQTFKPKKSTMLLYN